MRRSNKILVFSLIYIICFIYSFFFSTVYNDEIWNYGFSYNIASGRTLVGGTGYNIMFTPLIAAMLYSDGNMVFQIGTDVEEGKTLVGSYKDFINEYFYNAYSIPWYQKINNIVNISSKDQISPVSMSYWFYNARNLFSINFENMD